MTFIINAFEAQIMAAYQRNTFDFSYLIIPKSCTELSSINWRN